MSCFQLRLWEIICQEAQFDLQDSKIFLLNFAKLTALIPKRIWYFIILVSIWSHAINLSTYPVRCRVKYRVRRIRSGHRRLARSFNLCYRYIDDLIVFNNKRFLDYLKEIYPSQLTVEKANKSDHLADYLDLTFIIDSGGKLSTRPYDKRDDFDFHIVNFPFLSSNIPSGPSYGVYISQLIRYARCCSHYDDFRYRHKCLVDRLLSQGYKALRLEKSFKKFYGRYQDLIEKYRRSVNAMVSDSFPGQFLFNM